MGSFVGFGQKLKQHLLPCIKHLFKEQAATKLSYTPSESTSDSETCNDFNMVLFDKNWIYCHQLAQFNHTMYNVWRGQDIIHPNTSHCNVMLIAADTEAGEEPVHCFLYARVLGIYHANVIYTGPQSMDYRPLWMEFLWVRWYTWIQSQTAFDLIILPSLPWQTRIPLDLLTQLLYYEDVIFQCSPVGKFILMGVVYQGAPKMAVWTWVFPQVPNACQ